MACNCPLKLSSFALGLINTIGCSLMNDFEIRCPVCESGGCHEAVEDFKVGMPDGATLLVPRISVWHCAKCGARWLSPVAADALDEFVRRGGTWKKPGEH